MVTQNIIDILDKLTKIDRRNKTMARKLDDDVISDNCDIIVIFPIYGQFGAIWKPDSGRIFCNLLVT